MPHALPGFKPAFCFLRHPSSDVQGLSGVLVSLRSRRSRVCSGSVIQLCGPRRGVGSRWSLRLCHQKTSPANGQSLPFPSLASVPASSQFSFFGLLGESSCFCPVPLHSGASSCCYFVTTRACHFSVALQLTLGIPSR